MVKKGIGPSHLPEYTPIRDSSARGDGRHWPGPDNGFSLCCEGVLAYDHLVVSRQIPTIAPAC